MRIFHARLAYAPEHHRVSTNNKLSWNFTPRRVHNLKNLKQTKEDRNKKEKNWISDRLSQQGLKTQGYKLMVSHIRQQESLTKTPVSNFRQK